MKDVIQTEIKSTLDHVLGTAVYEVGEVAMWVETITSGVLDKLRNIHDGYKYIVSVIILQKSQAGFHLYSTCYWDATTDGNVTFKWENKSMHAVVSVYGVAL